MCSQMACLEGGTFTPDRLCDVNFSIYPMVEGGDGITSALERFDPFLCSRTSIGLYTFDICSGGRWSNLLLVAMGGRCPPWCGRVDEEDLKN